VRRPEAQVKMTDVDRQIRQMADFIRLEAKEKATEIRMKVRFGRRPSGRPAVGEGAASAETGAPGGPAGLLAATPPPRIRRCWAEESDGRGGAASGCAARPRDPQR
jgi:hypothetical protein